MKAVAFLKEHYILLGIMLLGIFLRLYHLEFQSIWLDEIHTMKESDPALSWKQFHDVITFREGIPHLYFLLVRLFFELFGYTIWSARFLSVIAGVLGIFGTYLLGKELFDKKAGLSAAALLAVNTFHIYYSQEARSYALLLMFTVFSFYFLIRFLKLPTWRMAIFFGLFTGLIAHAHPIGVTAILAAYLVVLFALLKMPTEHRKNFFLLSSLSGATALVVFYPVYQIISKVSDITSFWVPQPTPDVYSKLMLEFLGKSELTLFIFQLLFFYFAFQVFRQRERTNSWKEVIDSRLVLAFLVFVLWSALSLLIPLIRSYLLVPMIVSRYFINVLPVLLLIAGIAISLIQSKTVRVTVLASLLTLSAVDIFVVKQYYT
ncbi:MAG: hypothetical protein EOO01_11880, partial [Chitinophagaceae bacterium]